MREGGERVYDLGEGDAVMVLRIASRGFCINVSLTLFLRRLNAFFDASSGSYCAKRSRSCVAAFCFPSGWS